MHYLVLYCNLLKTFTKAIWIVDRIAFHMNCMEAAKWFKTVIVSHLQITVISIKFCPLLNLQYVTWNEGLENMIDIERIVLVPTGFKLVQYVYKIVLLISIWPGFIWITDIQLKSNFNFENSKESLIFNWMNVIHMKQGQKVRVPYVSKQVKFKTMRVVYSKWVN